MQIKIILLILVCLFGALFFVYREGYDKGFTTAIGQIQTQNAKHVDTVIKKANDVVINDEKVIDKFITTQAEFIKVVEMVSVREESNHETNNAVRIVGIGDDELYELQRLTRAANAH